MALCLAAGALTATLALESFTLAWTHSIEHQRWEEDWRVAGGRLDLLESRLRGFGAGMAPGEGAILRGGVFHDRPALPPQARLRLTHSPYAGHYELCAVSRCLTFEALLPGLPEYAVITVAPCP